MSVSTQLCRNAKTKDQDVREKVGVLVGSATATEMVDAVAGAEAAGVRQAWVGTSGMPDLLTSFAAAAVQTKQVRLGTSIVPAYPRHPLVMAQQALAINDLAPGRLRLGIGPGGRATIEEVFGLPMRSPLAYLREYTEILRTLLHHGNIEYKGGFFTVSATIPRIVPVPVLISAIGERAFELAGAVADGAISYMCPVPYLLNTALPALQRGAKTGDRPVPPLIAHVPVALSEDRQAVIAAGREQMRYLAGLARRFGFPVNDDGNVPDRFVESLVVSGTADTIRRQLLELLACGLDELMLTHVPVADAETECKRLMQLIGSL